jgi:hypothetical protein
VSSDLELRQFLGVCFNRIGQLQQQAATRHGGHVAPCRECLLGGGDGLVDVGSLRFRDLGDGGTVEGIDGGERGAVRRIDELASDEQFGLQFHLGCFVYPGADAVRQRAPQKKVAARGPPPLSHQERLFVRN